MNIKITNCEIMARSERTILSSWAYKRGRIVSTETVLAHEIILQRDER